MLWDMFFRFGEGVSGYWKIYFSQSLYGDRSNERKLSWGLSEIYKATEKLLVMR